jgi:hypothetical protein
MTLLPRLTETAQRQHCRARSGQWRAGAGHRAAVQSGHAVGRHIEVGRVGICNVSIQLIAKMGCDRWARLHTERLALDGLPVTRGGAASVKAAREAELSGLLTAGGVSRDLAAGGSLPGVNAPEARSPWGASAAQLGTQIARSVYVGIARR